MPRQRFSTIRGKPIIAVLSPPERKSLRTGYPVAIVTKILCCFVLVLYSLLFGVGSSSAEEVSFERHTVYQAGKADNKTTCRIVALERVKSLLFDAIASYLENQGSTEKLKLSKDDLTIRSVGVVVPEILEERWDGKILYLKARVVTDPVQMATSIDSLAKDPARLKDLEWLAKKREELSREAMTFSREIDASKAVSTKVDPKFVNAKVIEYQDTVKKLGSLDWFEKGFVLQQNSKHQEASRAYTKAIEMVPTFVRALFNRATTYSYTDRPRQALKDLDAVAGLTPDSKEVYLSRGAIRHKLSEYDLAVKDFNKVIALKADHADAYMVRGATYLKLGDFRLAAKDFSKVIELAPYLAEAYTMRGTAYFLLGEYKEAAENQATAISLKPDYPLAYFSRGSAFYRLNLLSDAIEDFGRAIELNSAYAEAYAMRGASYGGLGDYEKADADLKTAARLGDKDAQSFLSARGSKWE
jgi:tetratricopeptide (TPR) repeat protein